MEVVIGNDKMKVSGDNYNFCAPHYIGELVSSLDMQVLSTANNHTFDRGIEGINSTLDFFDSTDIVNVGTYRNQQDRETPRIVEKNGIKFGFLAYTLSTNQLVPQQYRNLVGLYRNKQMTGMIAAPIKISDNRYVCIVEVIANTNNQRLYLHEAFLIKNLQEIVATSPVHDNIIITSRQPQGENLFEDAASNLVHGSETTSPHPQGEIAKILQNYVTHPRHDGLHEVEIKYYIQKRLSNYLLGSHFCFTTLRHSVRQSEQQKGRCL